MVTTSMILYIVMATGKRPLMYFRRVISGPTGRTPMTNLPTTLEWVEYDGTAETLPIPIKSVLLCQTKCNSHEYNVVFLTSTNKWLLFYSKDGLAVNSGSHVHIFDMTIGDRWAYLREDD
jgi:hypothetical protein